MSDPEPEPEPPAPLQRESSSSSSSSEESLDGMEMDYLLGDYGDLVRLSQIVVCVWVHLPQPSLKRVRRLLNEIGYTVHTQSHILSPLR